MMLCYSKTRKIKYFLDPPPKKKAQGYERSRYVSTKGPLTLILRYHASFAKCP